MAKKDSLELEFLPAALEIIETPPSPLGRLIIWIIFILVIVSLLWSYFGTVDEVAVARGKIIPDGRLKVIQPLEEGIITAIYIKEGQKIKKGDLLIELDSTMKQVDVESLNKNLYISRLERDILNAELEGKSMESAMAKNTSILKTLSEEDIAPLRELKKAREIEYNEKRETAKLIITQRESELEQAKSNSTRLEKKYKDLKEEEESLRYLFKIGSIAKRKWQDKESELFSTEKEFEAQRSAVKQATDKIEEGKGNLASLEKERRTNILNQIIEKEKIIADVSSKLTKAQKTFELQKLFSPVDGTVNGLAAYTIGGVVTPAQPIVTIVPEDTPLSVEAMVLNRDIGFVRVGQEVELKLDTFPYQKYGIVKGTVMAISPDAVEDDKKELMYKIKVNMTQKDVIVKGKRIPIGPGMALTAEIKTGRRKIIEFFLSPMLAGMEDSLKLR